jgi:hypothetical protein
VALTLRLHNSSDLSAAQPVGPASRTVIFLINGVSPADLAGVSMPHLTDLARRGTTYGQAWVGQMENVGLASAATIATGALPRKTGLIGAAQRDPQAGTVQHPGAPEQVQLGAVDQIMQAAGATPLTVALKRVQPHSPVLAVGGAGCGVADAAGSWLAEFVLCPVRRGKAWVPGSVTGHALPARLARTIAVRTPVKTARSSVGWRIGAEDSFVARYAVRAMRATRPSLMIVSFDEAAQRKPSLSPAEASRVMPALLRGIDRDIGTVVVALRREGSLNRTAFIVTSGAAMPLEEMSVPAAILTQSVAAVGGQRVYAGTGESAPVGLQSNLQAQPVAQALQSRHLRGLDAVYYKTRTARRWAYQPQYLDPDLPAAFSATASYLLGTMASDAAPDVMVVLSPGYAVTRRGDNGAGGPGIQWDSQHVPLIVSGHGVRPGVRSGYPARLVDIAPTIAALMGAGPVASDGVVLADALQQPPSGSESAQRRTSARLGLYVSALENRLQAASR